MKNCDKIYSGKEHSNKTKKIEIGIDNLFMVKLTEKHNAAEITNRCVKFVVVFVN